MEDKLYNFRIQPAERLSSVQEYYFSVKLKEVARMNAEGKDIISLAIGSPDMPPSPQTIETLCEEARHADAHGYQPTTGIPELRRRWPISINGGTTWTWIRPAKYSHLSAPRKASSTSRWPWPIRATAYWCPIRDILLIRHSAKSSASKSPIMTCCPKTAGNPTSKPWKKWT